MATIYGRVYYSPSSYFDAIDGPILLDNEKVCIFPRSEVPKIPVVLVNSSGQGKCILTDSNGYFQFDQIPLGNYKVIESFGRTDGVSSPFSYSTGSFSSLGTVTPKDPTTVYIDSLGLALKNGNDIISLSSNTFTVNITNEMNSFEVNFIDAPIINSPMTLSGYKRIGNNLITAADNGTFGSCDPGTVAGTSPATAPTGYSALTDFKYIRYSTTSPDGGYYSICNILNLKAFNQAWHNSADHTKGDETGRVMIVNNDEPDKCFFRETISNLNPSMTYLFSGWFLNIYRFSGYHPPAFKLLVITSQNRVLAEKSIDNSLFSTTLPTWKEIGVIANLKELQSNEIVNNTASVTIKLISLYKETLGNDFLVDDLSFRQVIQTIPTLTKSADKNICSFDDEIKYTSIFTNNTESAVLKLIFIDSLTNGVTLSPLSTTSSENFSIKVNEFEKKTTITKSQLSQGIDISSILINSDIPSTIVNYADLKKGLIPVDVSVNIIFKAKIYNLDLIESKPIIYNTSSYNYTTAVNSYSETVTSNSSKVTVLYPEISVSKKMSKIINNAEVDLENNNFLHSSEKFIYKIIITNTGTKSVNNMVVADNIDTLITPIYSTNTDCVGITKEVISSTSSETINVLCSEIEKIDGNINNIKISNITVPAAVIAYSSEEKTVTPGITIIRISCRVKP